MTNPTRSKEPREDRLNELIAEYLRRVDRGEEVDPERFIAPHPELAESFARYLQDAALVDGLKQSRGVPHDEPLASRDTAGSLAAADETIPPSYVRQKRQETAESRQFGRYRLVRLLGQGAMGAVYLAEDPQLQRHVALKIPRFVDDEDAGSRERFYREARAAATLNHPNICPVHDIGEQDGTPFITMAYVQGNSLSKFIGVKRQWPEREVAKLVRKIALALTEAHAKGVVHRDLKPGNIMLDRRHEPIVTDFGLAGRANRPGEEKLTHTGMLLGTPAYMSPEQAEADFAQVGPQSDVYSLGVICYELLTGKVPFRGPVSAVIVQIVRDQPQRPSELRPSLDGRLEAICLKMMAKTPTDRYRTAAEVADALREFLEETAPTKKSSQQSAAEAVRQLEGRKQEIVRLLQGGQFGPAIDALQELARAAGPGSGAYAAWARGELARVRALPQEVLQKGTAMVETAIELVASQQYAEAVGLLEAVPADYRSTEAAKLLDKAAKLQQEADRLNARMHEAVRTRQYDGLQVDLARLLELQPGNLTARDLYDKLSTYAPGRPYRFSKDGKLLSAHRTPLLVLLGGILRQGLRAYAQRQKYRREPAARRVPSLTKPTPPRPGLPILQVALAAGALALILLTIVILLRDGRQTVRVEIDDALLADTSITLHIDGREMEIAGLGETIKLAPGDYGYELRRGDEVVRLGEFQVVKGDTTVLRISLGETPIDKPAELQQAPSRRGGGLTKPPLAVAPFDEDQAKRHQQAWADYLGVPLEMTNSIGMKLILIPPGQFDMGSSEAEIEELLGQNEGSNRFSSPELIRSEGPRHRVTITNPFYMGRHEVTVGQFRQFVQATGHKTSSGKDGEGAAGFNVPTGRLELGRDFNWESPGFAQSDGHPVASIGWDDAAAFCAWVTKEEGSVCRLPTEAEWEYACRAGTTTRWNSGNDRDALQGAGNIADAAFRLKCPNDRPWGASWDDGFPFTAPVGRFQPNAFGLHDMHGNVQEWCADWCDISYYQSAPVEDPCRRDSPKDLKEGFSSYRVFRGGGMRDCALRCRSASRAGLPPTWIDVNAGFRVVCEVEAKASPRHVAPEPAAHAAAPSRTVASGRLVSIGPAEEVRLTSRLVDFGDARLNCPALTSDGLVIVFGVRHPDIPASAWMAKRSNTQEPFGNASRLNDGDEPTIDGQGQEIVYVDHRRGARLMRRTRTYRDAQFGRPRPVFSDPPETTYVAPCLSQDGLKLLLCGGKTNDPAICTRRSRSEAWGTPTPFRVSVPGFDRRTPAFTATPNQLLVSVLGEEGPKHLAVVSSTDGGRTFADSKILQLQGTSGPVMRPHYCPATGEVFFQCWPGDSGSRIWKASFKGVLD
jgi:formylglycine-generating enzyme required for sulfatase activity/predicted Ser/Thr protein kinase